MEIITIIVILFILDPVVGVFGALATTVIYICMRVEKNRQQRELEQRRSAVCNSIRAYAENNRRIAEAKQMQKIADKEMKYQHVLSMAQNDIDHLEPIKRDIVKKIEELTNNRYWRTANGHYIDSDSKCDAELKKLKEKLYQIDKKLDKAHYDYECAERHLTGDV